MSTTYRPDIDGLRALAVTLVLAVHASPTRFPNGFIGVDVFFVISGFLITGILIDDLRAQRFSIRDFYIRRVNRIFPALLLVLALVVFAGPLIMYPDEYVRASLTSWTSTVFAANIGFYYEAGYWDIASKLKPLLHLWSLGVEEQFYLVWPLILWLAVRKRVSSWNACLVVIFLSLAVNIYLTSKNQAAAFYLPFGRFWELAVGGLLAIFQRQSAPSQPSVMATSGNWLAWGGLLLLVTVLRTPLDAKAFPGYYVVVVVLAGTLLIAAGPSAWVNRRILSHPALVYVGKISYPLYLWHWPLLVFARLMGDGQWSQSHRNMAVVGSIALAVLTYHGVERPLAKVRRRGVLALVLIALMIGMGAISWLAYKSVFTMGTKPYAAPPQAQYDYAKPATPSSGKIALLGDSNAGHFEYGLKWIYGDRLITYAMPGWPFLDGANWKKGHIPHPGHKGTPANTEVALDAITRDPEIRLVIVSNAYLMYLPADNLRTIDGPDSETGAQAYESGMRRTVQRLLASGKQVIVIEAIPTYPTLATALACSSRIRPWLRQQPEACVSPRGPIEAARQEYLGILRRALDGLPNVTRFNTMDELCDQRFCYLNRGGEQLYYDPGHFGAEGSQLVSAALARRIEQILQPR